MAAEAEAGSTKTGNHYESSGQEDLRSEVINILREELLSILRAELASSRDVQRQDLRDHTSTVGSLIEQQEGRIKALFQNLNTAAERIERRVSSGPPPPSLKQQSGAPQPRQPASQPPLLQEKERRESNQSGDSGVPAEPKVAQSAIKDVDVIRKGKGLDTHRPSTVSVTWDEDLTSERSASPRSSAIQEEEKSDSDNKAPVKPFYSKSYTLKLPTGDYVRSSAIRSESPSPDGEGKQKRRASRSMSGTCLSPSPSFSGGRASASRSPAASPTPGERPGERSNGARTKRASTFDQFQMVLPGNLEAFDTASNQDKSSANDSEEDGGPLQTIHSFSNLGEDDDTGNCQRDFESSSSSSCVSAALWSQRPNEDTKIEKEEQQREEWQTHVLQEVSAAINKIQIGRQKTTIGGYYFFLCSDALGETRLAKVCDHIAFQSAAAILIIANAIFISYDAHTSVGNALNSPGVKLESRNMEVINQVFALFFTLEILVRLAAKRLYFFFGKNWQWNVFDFVLVFLSVSELVLKGLNISSFRVLRAARVLRVVRLVPVLRFLRDLRIMVASIIQSLAVVMWGVILILGIMCLFAVCFMQAITMHINRGNASVEMLSEVNQWFSSLPRTLLTMLQAITGGVDWHEVSSPLAEIHWIYEVGFAFYITFVVIGVLNVLTGIFVDRAAELSGLDRDLVIHKEQKENRAFLTEMRQVFDQADQDQSGTVSWEEFKEYIKNGDVRSYLATKQLDANDAYKIFHILDVAEDQEVPIEDFIMGCMRLKGVAKSVDVVALGKENSKLSNKLNTLQEGLDNLFGLVSEMNTERDASSRRSSVRRESKMSRDGLRRPSNISNISAKDLNLRTNSKAGILAPGFVGRNGFDSHADKVVTIDRISIP